MTGVSPAPETAVMSPAPEAEVGAGNARGIALMVLSIALFIAMDGIVKHLVADYSVVQVLLFRCLFALIPLSLVIAGSGGIAALKTRRPWGHAFRATIGLLSLGCFFYAYKALPLTDAIAISFAAPLFMTALSVPLLKETVGVHRWSAVLVGFIGVLVILHPGAGILEPAVLVVLAGTLGYALVMITVRRLSRTETNAAIVFYFTVTGVVVGTAFMPWFWVTPSAGDLMLLVVVGLLGGMAQILMTEALRTSAIAVLAPFEYTSLLWAMLIDIAVWGTQPSLRTLTGAGVIVVTGLYIVHRETTLGRRRRVRARLARIRVSAARRETPEAAVRPPPDSS